MKFFNFQALVTVVLVASFPVVGSAHGLVITDPELCNATEEIVMDSGGFVMSENTVEAIEFICEFDPLPQLNLTEYHTLTSKGYCSGPMFFIPQAFAFNFGRDVGDIEMIGQFAQYVPSGRLVFHVCEK